MVSLAHDVSIALDHDGSYSWDSQPIVLPEAVTVGPSGYPDAFGTSYRVTGGTAVVSNVHSVPAVSASGETTVHVTFDAKGASAGAKFQIVDITATKANASDSEG